MELLREKARPGMPGKWSFKRIAPAVCLASLLVFVWGVILMDILGRTEYEDWMNMMIFYASTLVPTFMTYAFTRGKE